MKCRKCGKICDTDEMLGDHIKSEHPRRSNDITNEQLNEEHIHCNKPQCSNDSSEISPQNKAHNERNIFVCRNCKEKFETKWQLMNHRRDKHPSNKMCFYDAENKCSFSAD